MVLFPAGPSEVKKEVIIVSAQPQQCNYRKRSLLKNLPLLKLDKNGVKVEAKKV